MSLIDANFNSLAISQYNENSQLKRLESQNVFEWFMNNKSRVLNDQQAEKVAGVVEDIAKNLRDKLKGASETKESITYDVKWVKLIGPEESIENEDCFLKDIPLLLETELKIKVSVKKVKKAAQFKLEKDLVEKEVPAQPLNLIFSDKDIQGVVKQHSSPNLFLGLPTRQASIALSSIYQTFKNGIAKASCTLFVPLIYQRQEFIDVYKTIQFYEGIAPDLLQSKGIEVDRIEVTEANPSTKQLSLSFLFNSKEGKSEASSNSEEIEEEKFVSIEVQDDYWDFFKAIDYGMTHQREDLLKACQIHYQLNKADYEDVKKNFKMIGLFSQKNVLKWLHQFFPNSVLIKKIESLSNEVFGADVQEAVLKFGYDFIPASQEIAISLTNSVLQQVKSAQGNSKNEVVTSIKYPYSADDFRQFCEIYLYCKLCLADILEANRVKISNLTIQDNFYSGDNPVCGLKITVQLEMSSSKVGQSKEEKSDVGLKDYHHQDLITCSYFETFYKAISLDHQLLLEMCQFYLVSRPNEVREQGGFNNLEIEKKLRVLKWFKKHPQQKNMTIAWMEGVCLEYKEELRKISQNSSLVEFHPLIKELLEQKKSSLSQSSADLNKVKRSSSKDARQSLLLEKDGNSEESPKAPSPTKLFNTLRHMITKK